VCGNGLKEFAPETLKGTAAISCAINAATGGAIPTSNCELCDDGNTSDCGTCDHTCGTAFAQGPKTCPVGTSCVDDVDCTGTCDVATGKCVAECGNGILETPEVCDDGNTDACGPCNATCSAAGAGTCPVGTGCTTDAVCTSGMCVANVCQ
jgi:cysteine-rich repeat protein